MEVRLMKYFIITLLLLLAIPAYAGELELKITIPLTGNKPSPAEFQFGKSDVQIHFNRHFEYFVELGKFQWNHKYPKTLRHEDDRVDIDFSKLYTP